MMFLKMFEEFSDYSFNSGDCDIYAVAMHRLYGYPIFAVGGEYYDDLFDETAIEYAHLVVKKGEDKYLDYNGENSAEKLINNSYFSNNVENVKMVQVTENDALSMFSMSDQEDEILDVMSLIKSKSQ